MTYRTPLLIYLLFTRAASTASTGCEFMRHRVWLLNCPPDEQQGDDNKYAMHHNADGEGSTADFLPKARPVPVFSLWQLQDLYDLIFRGFVVWDGVIHRNRY